MTGSSPRIGTFATFLSVWLLSGGTTEAQEATQSTPVQEDRESFDTLVSQAVEAYEAGQFEQAVGFFGRAYELQPAPELIYNIARTYERAVQPERAVEYYERFLSLPATTAELRSRARSALEALRAELAVLQRAQQPPQAELEPPPAPASSAPPSREPRPTPANLMVEGPPSARKPDLSRWGWGLLGAGSALMVGGAVLFGLTLRQGAQAEQATTYADQQHHFGLGENLALGGDVLFFTGVAVALTAAALLVATAVQRRRTTSRASATALLPAPGLVR